MLDAFHQRQRDSCLASCYFFVPDVTLQAETGNGVEKIVAIEHGLLEPRHDADHSLSPLIHRILPNDLRPSFSDTKKFAPFFLL